MPPIQRGEFQRLGLLHCDTEAVAFTARASYILQRKLLLLGGFPELAVVESLTYARPQQARSCGFRGDGLSVMNKGEFGPVLPV